MQCVCFWFEWMERNEGSRRNGTVVFNLKGCGFGSFVLDVVR